MVARCPGWSSHPALPNPSDPGFGRPYDISYGGLKLPRVCAGFRRSYLRRGPIMPQVGPRPSVRGGVIPDAVGASEILSRARLEGGRSSGLVAVSRWRWRGDKAAHRTHRSSDSGAQGRTVSASSRSPDCSPTACADQTTTDGPLDRIIGVGASR